MASDDEDGIFKVETVPPPEGESDVYNAPTKVGMLAGSLVEEIVQQARRQAELSAQGRATPSGSPAPAESEEPAVVDPMTLLAVEQLAAREEAALRPAGLPSDLELEDAPPSDSITVEMPESARPASLPPPPRDLDGAARLPNDRPDLDATAAAPDVSPLTSVPPEPAPQSAPATPAARAPSRLSTVVLLALVLLFLAFGIYRLRR